MPSTEHTQPSAAGRQDGFRQLIRAVVDQWYQPWRTQWAAIRIADGPAVTFNPDACRAWLADGVADEHGIDDTFRTTELTIPAGLEALLAALDDNPQPQVWHRHPALRQVRIWRTADGDGVDGGAIITADLAIDGERVRLATLHQGFDDFTTDSATAGIDAAVEALDHVARLVNTELAAYRQSTAAPNGYTVIGDWDNDQPTPTAVVVARPPRFSAGAAVIQRPGWWAVAVNADDPDEAEQAAIAALATTATS
nr:hypothetical protein [Micromonospora purpureochromogenes]